MNNVDHTTVQLRGHGLEHRKFDGSVVAFLLVVGLYCPTSTSGDISKVLLGIDYAACMVVLLLLILKTSGSTSFATRLTLLAPVPLLFFFTVTFGFNTYSFGEITAFAILAVVFMLNLRQVTFPEWLYRLFAVVSIFNIALGVGVLVGSNLVGGFLVDHYGQFNSEMVPNMLLFRKPVLTFATHSLAGFFLYLFFYMSLQTYIIKGKKLFLIFAFCYLFLTMALLSVTGVILGFVGAAQTIYYFWLRIQHRWFGLAVVFAIIGVLASFRYLDPVIKNWNDLAQAGKAVLMSPDNGFLGRFTPGGTMYPAMQFLKEHPLRPLGVSSRPELLIGDMGFIDYLLRGSVFLVCWAYLGLFFFLKRSLIVRFDLYFLFGVILAFELGFSVLSYFRMLYLLPFFVIYLNGLRQCDGHLSRSGVIPQKQATAR